MKTSKYRWEVNFLFVSFLRITRRYEFQFKFKIETEINRGIISGIPRNDRNITWGRCAVNLQKLTAQRPHVIFRSLERQRLKSISNQVTIRHLSLHKLLYYISIAYSMTAIKKYLPLSESIDLCGKYLTFLKDFENITSFGTAVGALEPSGQFRIDLLPNFGLSSTQFLSVFLNK